MKRLFLTSDAAFVASKIAKELNQEGLKLLFITTASEVEGDDLWWLKEDRDALVAAGFVVTDYTITGKTSDEIEEAFRNTDILCFEGGNTFYLLQQIQQTGCGDIIRKEVESGKIYIGSSAGSVIASPDFSPLRYLDDPEKAPMVKGFGGLNLVDFVVAPHWASTSFKDSYLSERIENFYNSKNKIILLNDNQYVEVRDDWYRIVE